MTENSKPEPSLKGYELHELIAHGGHGRVYRAYQPVIDREVAIKVISAQYANHPDFIRRFEAEAQVIARLEHLHIVPLYDFWREPNNAYLVMRWMRGGSVRNSLKASGPWSLTDADRLVDQIASALAVAHRNMIVHRDLKPDNILLDEENNAYLADFGIAKDIRVQPDIIDAYDRVGSPDYMSPEQLSDIPVSPQTDIYSLGIALYEILTGQPPFQASSIPQLAYMHIRDPLPMLQKYRPDLPQALNLVLWRATEKQKEERYADVMTFAREFREVITQEVIDVSSYPLTRSTSPSIGESTRIIDTSMETQNPYKGLRAFQESDAVDFFGREASVAHLLARLSNSDKAQRFLALVGPSGSGKSSLMRAGLMPILRRGGLFSSQDWFYSQMVPGTAPLDHLTEALIAITPEPPENLRDRLRAGSGGLIEMTSQFLTDAREEYCLLIDQFEEVFTLVEDEAERLWFLNTLYEAATDVNSRVRIFITLRADFYDRPLLYSGFADLIRAHTEVILPMRPEELEYAVIRPAQRLQIRFEAGLVSRMITDVNSQPGSLPLLEYALTELFERRQDRLLTNAAYESIRGVSGALAQRAEELYQCFSPESQEATQNIMLRLIALGENGEATRQRVLRADLLAIPGDVQAVRTTLESFGRYRLLTFDYDIQSRQPTVELAHEVLITTWDRLAEWLTNNKDRLRIQRRLVAAESEWNRSGNERSFLASGARLAEFELLRDSQAVALTEAEQNYLQASIEQRQRNSRRLRWFIGGLIATVIVVAAIALFALQQRAVADQLALTARSRELAATALAHRDQLDLSLLLSVEALRVLDTFEARSSLLSGLQAQPDLETFIPTEELAARAVAFSPDGRYLATAGRGATIVIWDVEKQQQVGAALVGHSDWINSLAFNADGNLLASASSDGTVRLWNPLTGMAVGSPFGDGQDAVWAVAFSPDGTLASAGSDAVIRLWDIETGTVKRTLQGHEDVIYSLAFSPDGSLLASGSADNTVRLWNPLNGEVLHTFADHSNWVLSVAFSPDGKLLASSGADETVVQWDSTSYETRKIFSTGQSDWVRSLAFSGDGEILAAASQDRTIRLFDPAAATPVRSPLEFADGVWNIAFRPASTTHELASADASGKTSLWTLDAAPALVTEQINSTEPITSLTFASNQDVLFYSSGNITSGANENTGIHRWDVEQGQEQPIMDGQNGTITGLVYAARMNRLFSSSTDGTLFAWDLNEVQPTAIPYAQENAQLLALALSPDGKRIAIGDANGVIYLFNASDGKPVAAPLRGHEDSILGLAFHPDGQLLASASRDHTIRLWNLRNSSAPPDVLQGHQDTVSSVTFSDDGQLLVSASYDGTVRLWNGSSGIAIGQPLTGGGKEIWSVALDTLGQTIASGGQDDTLQLWNVAARQMMGIPLTGHDDWITTLAFNSDASRLATGSLDASILLWDTNLQSWQQRACTIAHRNLTQAEWERYFPDAVYHTTC